MPAYYSQGILIYVRLAYIFLKETNFRMENSDTDPSQAAERAHATTTGDHVARRHRSLHTQRSSWQRMSDAAVELVYSYRIGYTHLNPNSCIHLSRGDKCYRNMTISEVAALPRAPGSLRVVAISDTHGAHESLGGQLAALGKFDVLIHCGDILFSSRNQSRATAARKYAAFNEWLGSVDCEHRVVVAGNHDFLLEEIGMVATQTLLSNCIYLEHSGVTLGGSLRLWGTPISEGHSRNRAFQSQQAAANALDKAAGDVDILIAHGPPTRDLLDRATPRMLIVSGHFHEGYGVRKWTKGQRVRGRGRAHGGPREGEETGGDTNVWYVSASTMNARYDPSFGPIVIDL